MAGSGVARKGSGRTLRIGRHATTQQPLYLPLDALMRSHTWVVGSTQSGKSRLLRHLAQELIDAGYPTVLIDGKGDLVEDLLKHCAERMIGPDRLVVLDPSEGSFVPGFNPCKLDGMDPYARATTVMRALVKVFGESDEFKPWLLDYGRHSIVALARAGLSLLDLEPFLRSELVRESLLERQADARLSAFWAHVGNLPRQEREARISAALTRVSLLFSSAEGVRRILGSPVTIDLAALIAGDGILLVNASESANVDQSAASLLGIVVLQKLLEVCSRRRRSERKPVFCILDEAQEFASEDVVRSLAKACGWGLHLVVAHQDLEQLQRVRGLYSAVRGNALNRFVFRGAAADHELLAEELFTGYLGERRIIQELEATRFRPKQRWVDVETRTSGRSLARHPEVESRREHPGTEGRSEGEATAVGVGTTASQQAGQATSTTFATTRQAGRSRTDPYSEVSRTAAHEIESESESVSVTPVFITEQEEFREISSRQLEDLAELKERAKALLVNQPPQHCVVKLQQTKPEPLLVQYVPDPPVNDRTVAAYKRLLLRNFPASDEIDRRIETRQRALLAQQSQTYDVIPDHIENPQDAPVPARDQGRPRVRRGRGRHPEAGGRGP